MNLDIRIKSISDIFTCINIEEAKQFIGKRGYFADCMISFEDLSQRELYTLDSIDDDDVPFVSGNVHWRYFLPVDNLKPTEKKYRSYTLMEFNDKFTIGRPIKYRLKGRAGREHYLMLLGFWLTSDKDQTIPYISIGHFTYTLDELFEEYEWQEHYTEDFKPFGVEE